MMRAVIPIEAESSHDGLTAVITVGRLEEMFRELIQNAVKSQKASPSPLTEYYLVSLLSGAVNSTSLILTDPVADLSFAETYFALKNKCGAEREEKLRQLGDRALFVSGFFSDCLMRKNVNPKFYHRMGSLAYARLADEVEPSPLFEMFRELSKDFSTFVSILGEVSEHTAVHRDRRTLAVYEKWLWTDSNSAYRELVDSGIHPIRIEASTVQ